MLDKFNRQINYLRVSVTDRCNLRCSYCMPDEGVAMLRHDEILSFEEIVDIVKIGVDLGIDKVRITGGEPLVRKGIINLVKMIAEIPGIIDFGMTTNGIYLEKYAQELKQAGLHRINVSLDTMDATRYSQITHGGDISQVLLGIKAAQKAKLEPVKINCVVKSSSNEEDAIEVKRFCEENGLKVRFIRLMNLKNGVFSIVEHGEGGNCAQCNRLRLTANGILKPCLFDNKEYDIRQLGIREAFNMALENKPVCGSYNSTNKFSNIGG